MPKYISDRVRNLKVGIDTYTDDDTVLVSSGNVGIGTETATGTGDTVLHVKGSNSVNSVSNYGSISLENPSDSGTYYAGSIDYYTAGQHTAQIKALKATGGPSGVGYIEHYVQNSSSNLENTFTIAPSFVNVGKTNGASSAKFQVFNTSNGADADGINLGNMATPSGSNISLNFVDYQANPYFSLKGVYSGSPKTGDLAFFANNGSATQTEIMRCSASGSLNFPDNNKLILGDSDDFQFYFDGSSSRIDSVNSSLKVRSDFVEFQNGAGTGTVASFNGTFARLFYQGSVVLQTVSGGVSIVGTLTSDGLDLGDNDRLRLGDSQDLQIYHNGSNSVIQDTGTGSLILGGSNSVEIRNGAVNETAAKFITDGAVELYYDNSKKFETTSGGIQIYGTTVAATSAVISGPDEIVIDPATVGDNTGTVVIKGDLQIDGTTTTVNSTTVTIDDKNIVLASGAANAAASDGGGITLDGANATLTYASTGDKWVFNKVPYYNTNRILTTADEGSGNGLDADTLDGQEGSYYQPASTALTTSTTFGGDVSGTYNAIVVADDSHNHVISNVDGLQSALDNKLSLSGGQLTGNITFSGTQTVDGRDLSVDGAKLDNIEPNATADQTAGEILSALLTVDGTGSSLDADLLDGQQGSYYLNTATTFGGDVSGTYNAIVVSDDSHNHAFDNLTGKTAGSGDYKTTGTFIGNTLTSTVTTGTAPLTVTSTTLVTNLNADLLDGQQGSFYQPASTALTTSTTFGGDVSGTYNAIVVADDSHNHVISNIDNLQTTLDDKLDTSTTFGGDVSGTYDAIVVANDSHTHDGRYFTETESDARYLGINDKAADSDLLDGQDGSYYLNTSTTFGGDVSGTYNAIVVANDSHTHDTRYYTETESDARYLGITAKAADSNLLDGLDSTQFLRSDTSDTASGVITFSSDINVADKIVHDGDTDTAIRFPAADTFAVETAGVERFKIDSSGDYDVKQARLCFNGINFGSFISGDGYDVYVNLRQTSKQFGIYSGGRSNANQKFRIIPQTSSWDLDFSAASSQPIDLRVISGNVEKLRVTSAGNVGIATTTPTEKLDITAGFVPEARRIKFGVDSSLTTGEIFCTENGGYNRALSLGGSDIIFATDGGGNTTRTERVRITNTGNVGIATTTPSKKLTVNGDILITDENKIFLNSNADLAINTRKIFGNANFKYLWISSFDGPPAPYTITQSSNDYSDFSNTNLALTYVSGTQPSGTVYAYVSITSNTIDILAIRQTSSFDYDDTTVFEISTSTIGSGTQNLQFKILNSNFTRPVTQFLSVGGDTEPTNYTYTPNLLKIGNANFENLSSVTSLNGIVSVGHNSFNGTLPSAINSAAFGNSVAQNARTVNYCAFLGNIHAGYGQTYSTSVGIGYQFSMYRNANWDIGIGHETVGESAPRGSTELTYTITTQPTSMPADGTYNNVVFNDDLGTKTYSYNLTIVVSGGAITSTSLGFAFLPKDLPAVNDVMSTTNASFAGMELTVNSVTEIGGGYNVGVGGYTLRYIDGASGNTGIGHAALNNIGTGSYNTALGYTAGSAITTGSYNVVIGSNDGSTIATSSNNIILSDGQGNIRQFIDSAGNVGIATTSPTQKLEVNGTALATALSTGASGTGINISTDTISGPATLTIDPAAVGDNTGLVVIKGDLQIDGTTTTINSTTVNVDDLNLTLASGAANASAADGGGITIDGASASITYASTGDKWVFNKVPYYNTNRLLTTADEGSGNGLDADTLDGQEGSYYQPASTALTTSTTFGGDVSGTYNAIVVANDSHTHDGRYFTETESDARYLGITAKAADSNLLDGLDSTQFLRSDANDSTSGQITFTKANNTATGGGQIYLNGATGNRIDWNTNGVAAPALNTRSAGTKLVLWPAVSSSNVDYALGIEGSTLWYSVPSTSQNHKWYGGTTEMMKLTNSVLTVGGNTVWNAGNDGAGSTLDSDTVDGLQASQFLRSDTADTASGVITFSSDINVADKIVHDGDTNTAIRFPAADTFTVETTGIERFRVSSTGNIGIGSSGPPSTLTINYSNATAYSSTFTPSSGYLPSVIDGLAVENTNNSISSPFSSLHFRAVGSSGQAAGKIILGNSTAGSGFFAFQLRDSAHTSEVKEKVRITSSGRVGINTTSPTEKLEVNGNIKLSSNGTGNSASSYDLLFYGTSSTAVQKNQAKISSSPWTSNTNAGVLKFFTNSSTNVVTERMVIDGDGDVGIGTDSPTTPLFVRRSSSGNIVDSLTLSNYAGGADEGSSIVFESGAAAGAKIIGKRSGTNGHELRFQTTSSHNGTPTDRVTINKDGNVGVGTTNPLSTLHLSNAGAEGMEIYIANAANINVIQHYNRSGAAYVTHRNVALDHRFESSGTEALRIASSGNVGIGTSFPDSELHVKGSTNSTLILEAVGGDDSRIWFADAFSNNPGVIEYDHNLNKLILGTTDGTADVTIDGSGNVGVGTSTPAYKLEVNGSFAATTKSFVIDHPTKEGKKLRYGSLEGPENGVYVRGKSTEFVIELPEYWTKLVDEDSITVNLTAIGKSQSLWVKDIKDNKIYIGSKCTTVKYFYTVFGERCDVEKLEVEY